MKSTMAGLFAMCMFGAYAEDGARLDLFRHFRQTNAWAVSAETFLGETQMNGFRFLDTAHRAAVGTDSARMAFLGLPVYEARVYFDAGRVRRVEASLFNRGDAAEPLTATAFDAAVQTIRAKLRAVLAPGTDGNAEDAKGNTCVQRFVWLNQFPAVQLEWAYVRPHRSAGKSIAYRADYITVCLVPTTDSVAKDRAALTGRGILAKAKNTNDLRANIRNETNGEVWIDSIPMVDQGQKGYCAAATAERLLRYFGREVDEHRIAQLADTHAREGTSFRAMADAVTQIGRSFGLEVRELIQIETGCDFMRSDLKRQIDAYNMVARAMRKPVIVWENYVEGRTLNAMAIGAAMDPAILLKSRLRQRRDYAAFQRNIRSAIDAGIPLIWSCWVGLYPENPPVNVNGIAGHIRLIIGYTAKGEIIYSDSWGIAHARKVMPQETAWAMTQGLLLLKPHL